MKLIVNTISDLLKVYDVITSILNKNEPVEITIENQHLTRTQKQLRSFWLLINKIKSWMNEQGNNFTQEQVCYYFKIKSGLYEEKDGVKMPKSISNFGNISKKEMKQLIDTVLEFGIDNNIPDCMIEPYELSSLLENYN